MFRLTTPRLLPLLAALWLIGIVIGLRSITAYHARPGRSEPLTAVTLPAERWPADTQRLVTMFVHPRCPCTRASLAEFAKIAAGAPRQTRFEIMLVRPAGAAADWEQSDLVQTAAAIPDVAVHIDEEGRVAKQFGAATSGHVVVGDAGGKILFSGGITRSRGHEGESTGSRKLMAALHEKGTAIASNAVFGCPLLHGREANSLDACSLEQCTGSQRRDDNSTPGDAP